MIHNPINCSYLKTGLLSSKALLGLNFIVIRIKNWTYLFNV